MMMDVKAYQDCYFNLLAFEKNFRQFIQRKVGDNDLTFSHIMILIYLDSYGSCGQKELTVTFNASSAAMAVSIARLEEKGLITKTADEEDKRNNIIDISPVGHNYVAEIMAQRNEALASEKENEILSTEEISLLTKLQKKLFSQLKMVAAIQ